jgi:hypothetical protein
MPRGGARKGAGRKPKPLAEKLAAGNPGRRSLKKLAFSGESDRPKPPAYLRLMRKDTDGIPEPTAIFEEAVRFLEPSGCLNLIPAALIADYAMAKYYLIHAQYELSKTATVAYNSKRELVITDFTEAMLKLQRNVIATWSPIWDIVSKNSEWLIPNPEQDLMAILIGGRQRRKRTKGDAPDDVDGHPENIGFAAESGEI